MAYKWSWAFGPETSTELNDLAQWEIINTAQFQPSQATIHTYVGDAADRWAMQMDYSSGGMLAPLSVGGGKGWIGFYFYFNDPDNDFEARNILEIEGPVSGPRDIWITGAGGNGFTIWIDSIQVATAAGLGLQKDTWHHLAVKYDMTTGVSSHWGAELFINGVSVASGSRTSGNLQEESVANFRFNALEDAGFYTMLSDIVVYDELTDPNPYGQLVTRTGPTQDLSDSGSWTPASDGVTDAQSANLTGQIATTPVVAEADPLTGEYVRVNTDILGTTLGLDSFNTYGVTAHLYASGSSATNIIAGIGHNPAGPFTTGSAVVDGINAYAWTSSGSVGLVSGSSFVLNAEISGS